MKRSLLSLEVINVSRTNKKSTKFWFTREIQILKNMSWRRFGNSSSEMHAFNSNLTEMMTLVCFSSAKVSSVVSTTLMRLKIESVSWNIKKP